MGALGNHGVTLQWSVERRITLARGACDEVLQRSCDSVEGMLLHEALGVSKERAAGIDARARGEGGCEFVLTDVGPESPPKGSESSRICLRLDLAMADGAPAASILNLTSLLQGAPPIQISRLSSSLSHEIRNPLSSVKMAVQTLARNKDLSEKDYRRLSIAQREIRTVERMLWLLSEYARDTRPHLESVNIRGVVQQAQEMIETELLERQVSIQLSGPDDLPRVTVDAARTRPVLAQMLLNIAMGLEPKQFAEISVLAKDGMVELHLRDTAARLLPEEHDSLFEPFGSKLARGAGLTLAAVKQVMQQQGGQVTADDIPSGGALFILSFPAG